MQPTILSYAPKKNSMKSGDVRAAALFTPSSRAISFKLSIKTGKSTLLGHLVKQVSQDAQIQMVVLERTLSRSPS